MKVICPKCGQVLTGDDMNVATDVACCRQCNEIFALSSLVKANELGPVDLKLNNEHRGTSF